MKLQVIADALLTSGSQRLVEAADGAGRPSPFASQLLRPLRPVGGPVGPRRDGVNAAAAAATTAGDANKTRQDKTNLVDVGSGRSNGEGRMRACSLTTLFVG